ncbi:MAG: hypothetical protein HYX63_02905 [Gammaproteobacteria bacterium]|nr:hypothetical protein [Gammaproteobacteria bacterium]
MRTRRVVLFSTLILQTSLLAVSANAADAARANPPRATHTDAASDLPPLPAGVEELNFKDFYKMPIGPRGLEPTEKLRGLGGKRVRLIGYMVREDEPAPGVFMLTPLPVALAESADGPADDLPATTVFVHMPGKDRNRVLPYRAGRWVLTGMLDLGGKPEPNSRVSYTRLVLDDSAVTASAADFDSRTSAVPRETTVAHGN